MDEKEEWRRKETKWWKNKKIKLTFSSSESVTVEEEDEDDATFPDSTLPFWSIFLENFTVTGFGKAPMTWKNVIDKNMEITKKITKNNNKCTHSVCPLLIYRNSNSKNEILSILNYITLSITTFYLVSYF